MPEQSVRFGVASADGRRAATWKCWSILGKGKSDVYLTCRALRGSLKLSLHETGQWHIAFDSDQFPNLFTEGMQPASRYAKRWMRPPEVGAGLTLACRIHTPWYAVTISDETLDPRVVWLSCPREGNSSEVAVFLANSDASCTTWPGACAMGTSLVGDFALDDGGRVWLVFREVPIAEPKIPSGGAPRFFKGAARRDLRGAGLRAVTWWTAADGSLVLFEAPVRVDTGDARRSS